jgi:hypothetical protein
VDDNLIRTGHMSAGKLVLYPDITTLTDNPESGVVDVSLAQHPARQGAIAARPLVILKSIPVPEHYAVAVRKTDPELLASINHGPC